MISEAVLMDNMEYMGKFPNKFFDLAIPDPPYFDGPNKKKYYGKSISLTKINRTKYPVNNNWNIPDQKWLDEVKRVSKHQIIFGINYMPFIHTAGRIVWDKCNGESSYSDCEIASCTYHDSVRLFRFMWNGMMQGKSISEGHIQRGDKSKNQKRIHQTEKPYELYQWMYKTYIPDGGKVLDTNLGSGSSRIAADLAGNIDFYGCEIFDVSFYGQEKRWSDYKKQQVIQFPK